jgi:hypothetical protein
VAIPIPNLDVNASSTLASSHSTGASVGAFPALPSPAANPSNYTPLLLGLGFLGLGGLVAWLLLRKG